MTARDFDHELVADVYEATEPDITFEEDLRATVSALVDPTVRAALDQFGPLPEFRSPAFLRADPLVQHAILLVCGEAWLLNDPREIAERIVAERFNAVAKAIHAADPTLWRDLARRRAELGTSLPEYRRKRGAA